MGRPAASYARADNWVGTLLRYVEISPWLIATDAGAGGLAALGARRWAARLPKMRTGRKASSASRVKKAFICGVS